VLGSFGGTDEGGRKAYVNCVEGGVGQSHQDELTGGGLIHSVGGWSEVKRLREQGKDYVMSDERIPGGSEVMEQVLREALEGYEKRTLLKRKGMDLKKLMENVAGYF
jgi:putative transposase